MNARDIQCFLLPRLPHDETDSAPVAGAAGLRHATGTRPTSRLLKEENRILRARLPQRIVTTPAERRRLLKVGRKLGTQLKELITIVSYGSFRRWIREAEARRTESATETSNRRGGRPKTNEEIRELILQIRTDTGYGLTKIRQELAKLGIRLSRQTVKNVLVASGHNPMPPGGADSWDAFLQRHAQTLFQCDFITKPMWTLKGLVDLYLIVFIHLGTRRIWVTPCTTQPDSAWVAQQGRKFLMQAEEMELGVGQVIHDRDTKFTAQFDEILTAAGAKVQKTPIRSPNLQAHVERVVQTLQHEVLDHFVVLSTRHLNHIVREGVVWYYTERGHSVRNNLPPAWEQPPPEVTTIRLRDVVCTTRLGGLLKNYSQRAA